jgi:hypothetical protein
VLALDTRARLLKDHSHSTGADDDVSDPRVGEVIEASTASFTAQAYQTNEAPPFGSFVWVEDGTRRIVGAVCHAVTGPLDAGRRLVARGHDGLTRDEIFREHPELPLLLRTVFTVRVLGSVEDGVVLHRVPPRPAPLHEPVRTCGMADIAAFTRNPAYLATLLSPGPEVPAEELAAAVVRHAAQAHGDQRGYLVAAGRELARLMGGDPARLMSVLTRMAP